MSTEPKELRPEQKREIAERAQWPVRSYGVDYQKQAEADVRALLGHVAALEKILDERFRLWDIVANREGPHSTRGCPLRSGAEAYDEAVVTSISPFVLVSLAGDMRWSCIRPEERAHLTVLRPGTVGETRNAAARMARDKS